MLIRTQKYIVLIFVISFLFATVTYAQVKKADLAGSWYSASEKELLAQLNRYLDRAESIDIDGNIIGVISPHAGYVYSGPVAAYGFKILKNMDIDTVLVIGFSHRRFYDGIAVFDGEAYQSPLGMVKINRDVTKGLIDEHEKIYSYPIAFEGENSIEMQIPFLQAVLKDFKLVLIAMGDQSYENCEIIANALHNVLKDKDKFLLIASTDMCHYLPYDEANRVDKNTISIINEFNPRKLYTESLIQNHRLMCGYGAVCATMLATKSLGADSINTLKYANSGDTAGDKSQVVGYLSAAIVKSEIRNPKSETNPKSEIQNLKEEGEESMLNKEQRRKMLKLARDTIVYYLKEGKRLSLDEKDPVLNKEMGAFVTLHKQGQLRGCIGNMVGKGPFYLTVCDMAIEAATGDPRFRPVTLDEMEDVDIEISALSPLEKIDDPEKIEVGKHGVLVRKGFISGVYLPQVATETGWNREQFMNSLCGHKAGMSPDAWKRGECEIYVFTAEVFGEK